MSSMCVAPRGTGSFFAMSGDVPVASDRMPSWYVTHCAGVMVPWMSIASPVLTNSSSLGIQSHSSAWKTSLSCIDEGERLDDPLLHDLRVS